MTACRDVSTWRSWAWGPGTGQQRSLSQEGLHLSKVIESEQQGLKSALRHWECLSPPPKHPRSFLWTWYTLKEQERASLPSDLDCCCCSTPWSSLIHWNHKPGRDTVRQEEVGTSQSCPGWGTGRPGRPECLHAIGASFIPAEWKRVGEAAEGLLRIPVSSTQATGYPVYGGLAC